MNIRGYTDVFYIAEIGRKRMYRDIRVYDEHATSLILEEDLSSGRLKKHLATWYRIYGRIIGLKRAGRFCCAGGSWSDVRVES